MKNLLIIFMLIVPGALMGQAGGQQRNGTQERSREQGSNPDRVTVNVPSSLLSSPKNVIVPAEELPKAITDNVAREHSGFTVKEAKWDWSTTLVPGNIFVYQVVITNGKKDQLLLYNREGKYLKPGTVQN
jgi:hypothetical protein